MKKIIPTICMSLLGLSAIATSSYAWFSMNKTVTATGMKVQARAEGGIEIKRKEASGNFSDTATSTNSTAKLLPTSTADATKWSHAEGTSNTDGTGIADSYQKLTIADTAPTSTAIGTGNASSDSSLNYYIYDTYTVQSDANSGNFKNLYVSEVSVASSSNDLSSALRVLIKSGSFVMIACPLSTDSTSYSFYEDKGATAVAVTAYDYSASKTTPVGKDTYNVVAADAKTVDVSVYIYFEGEDENCKTENIASTLDELTVTVKFTAESIAAK